MHLGDGVSHFLHALDAVGPDFLALLLDPVLLLAAQQFLHVALVLFALEADLVVELVLEGAPLLRQHLLVHAALLRRDVLPNDGQHLVDVLVLRHPLPADLAALLEDLLKLGIVALRYPVARVSGPVGKLPLPFNWSQLPTAGLLRTAPRRVVRIAAHTNALALTAPPPLAPLQQLRRPTQNTEYTPQVSLAIAGAPLKGVQLETGVALWRKVSPDCLGLLR